MGHPLPIQALQLSELNEHTPAAAIPALLAPLKADTMSACCPKRVAPRWPIPVRRWSWPRIAKALPSSR